MQENKLMSVEEASKLILEGRQLVISGVETLLDQLPKGQWIGGTIPYFYIKGEKGRVDKSHVFVTDFTETVSNVKIETLTNDTIQNVCVNGFENGFNFLILPYGQDIHLSFALNSPSYENLFTNPVIGLIAGVELSELKENKPSKTYNGVTGESSTDCGVVLHAELPQNQVARLEIVNAFDPSNQMKVEVEENAFEISECFVDGEKTSLYDYIKANDIDIRLPLVSDYAGANVNVSFQKLDDEKKTVVFYAPLFKGKEYTIAQNVENYVKTFRSKGDEQLAHEKKIIYNCNCILNYAYGEMEKEGIDYSGTVTFGEIAYHLLNQTFTYLVIDEY